MTGQEYLNELIGDLVKFTEFRNNGMKDMSEMLESKNIEGNPDIIELINENLLSEEEFDKYYDVSQIIVDCNILGKKIADFIYFSKVYKEELDLSGLEDVFGLLDLVQNYKPYETTFFVDQNEQLNETDLDSYKVNKDNFKKIAKNPKLLFNQNEN